MTTDSPKISVLSPTMRGLRALAPVEQSLQEQTFESWEWLVEFGDGVHYTINRDWNAMLRRARGELIVFAQDWLWFKPDGLAKFWDAYKSNPKHFFTSPVPKSPGFWEMQGRLFYKKPLANEWRADSRGEVTWYRWEIDWGAAPLKPLKDIGGFDEVMDQGWGGDNQNVAYRAEKAGWRFMNLIDNPAVALDHDALWKNPLRHRHNIAWSNEKIARLDTETLPPLE
jgi:hypothetical protein